MTTSTTTDIDDPQTRDLYLKGLDLIKELKKNELRDPENILRILLEKLDEFRMEWEVNAYHRGLADGLAESSKSD